MVARILGIWSKRREIVSRGATIVPVRKMSLRGQDGQYLRIVTSSLPRPLSDVSSARWLADALAAGEKTVSSFVPAGADAYVRVALDRDEAEPMGMYGNGVYVAGPVAMADKLLASPLLRPRRVTADEVRTGEYD